jgi:SAM-dependent methyltransferase
LVRDHLALFCCPACRSDLVLAHDGLLCVGGAHRFACDGAVPLLFAPCATRADVTDTMRAFYEESPFPGYEDLESPASLRAKAECAVFPRLLDTQIPWGAHILEVGCGTGQLGNYLGLSAGRTVFGADMCRASLRLAEAFRSRHGIDRAGFVQMNLFAPAFHDASFDLVICNGVLHHTGDPGAGFRSIARLVKPGGFVLIGLYNRWGRLQTALRRQLFRLSPGWRALDFRLRDTAVGAARRRSWFMDQYRNPHESTHTMGELLRWFATAEFEFVSGMPSPRAFEPPGYADRLFQPSPPGTVLDRALVQLGLAVRGGTEGGLFTMIARRGDTASAPHAPRDRESGTDIGRRKSAPT